LGCGRARHALADQKKVGMRDGLHSTQGIHPPLPLLISISIRLRYRFNHLSDL
jgi:hypothetical protein